MINDYSKLLSYCYGKNAILSKNISTNLKNCSKNYSKFSKTTQFSQIIINMNHFNHLKLP
jgi:hypothetical protein